MMSAIEGIPPGTGAAGRPSASSLTKLPLPARLTTRPSSTSNSMARLTVVRERPCSSMNSRSEGNISPGT